MTARNPAITIDQSQRGDRNDQERTDLSYYQGPTPHGIYHQIQAGNRGLIGNDMNTYPPEDSSTRIPHHNAPRKSAGRASNAGLPLADDTAYIPGWAIGDPR